MRVPTSGDPTRYSLSSCEAWDKSLYNASPRTGPGIEVDAVTICKLRRTLAASLHCHIARMESCTWMSDWIRSITSEIL